MDSPPSASTSKTRAKRTSSRRVYASRYPGQEPPVTPSSSSATTSPTGSHDVERPKRSRVTTEQLVQLETLFAADRSPSVERRKEISALLGMHVRQTQIWFQNRRAKEKLREGRVPKPRQQRKQPSAEPPLSPPGLSTGFDVELHALVNEEAPITVIPCDTLTIGTWKRLRASEAKHSLVAYFCDSQHRLSWFVHSAGKGFKMSMPFNTITSAEFNHGTEEAGTGIATLVISRPPLFSFETTGVEPGTMGTIRRWRECHDWTEYFQASRVFRHDLTGPSGPLAHFVRSLQSRLRASLEDARSSPSELSSSELSSQGSISPLETRAGLPAAEVFEPAFASHVMYYPSMMKMESSSQPFHGNSTTPTPQSYYASAANSQELLREASYSSQHQLSPPQVMSPVSNGTGLPGPAASDSRFHSLQTSPYYSAYSAAVPPEPNYPQPSSPPMQETSYSVPGCVPSTSTLTRYYTLEYPSEDRTTPTATTATSGSDIPPPPPAFCTTATSTLTATYNFTPLYGGLTMAPQSYATPSGLNLDEEPALISPAPYSASAQRLQEDFLATYQHRQHHQ